MRVEGFEEGLVEVGDGFFALEDVKETGLDAVEGFAGELEDFGELDGVEMAAIGDFAEEFTEDGDLEVVVCEPPIEGGIGLATFRGMTPEDPGGEDAVEEGLDEGGTEEVLAFLAFELDAEGLFKRSLNVAKGGKVMVFGTGTSFAGVGG